MKSFYLPGLNGIRAIACLMVFYTHYNFEVAKSYSFKFHEIELGSFGVTCFFTLSGFLITTLLLQEKENANKINFKNFYIRRILRIWPLYYLLLLMGFLFFLNYHFTDEKLSNFLFYIFFIGNFGYSFGKVIWSVNVLWSVGVEEQFYAIWPFVINSKNVKRSIFLVVFIYLLIKLFFRITSPHSAAYTFWGRTRIDSMAIGGILAYLNFTNSPLVKILYNKICQMIVWAIFASSFIITFHVTSFLDDEFYSIIIGIIILNISYNSKTILSLENPILKYIGKISYGIYAYHMIIIILWNVIVPKTRITQIPHADYLLPFFLLAITLLVAHVSYFYFERLFLVKKDKYSVVHTAMAN